MVWGRILCIVGVLVFPATVKVCAEVPLGDGELDSETVAPAARSTEVGRVGASQREAARSVTANLPARGWVLTWENDALARSDIHYTNGFRLVHSLPLPTLEPETWSLWQRAAAAIIPARWLETLWPGDCEGQTFPQCFRPSVGWAVGQNIYTPADIREREVLLEDRPYAGWLYLGGLMQFRRPQQLHTAEVDLGVVGPISLAEPVQTGLHEGLTALGKPVARPEGWDNQLEHEVVLQFRYKLKLQPENWALHWRGLRLADVIPHGGFSCGSVFGFLQAGITARLGWNVAHDFGNEYNPSIFEAENRRKMELYAYIGFDNRWIFWNRFLDGTSSPFGESHSVDRLAQVRDLELGLAFRPPDSVRWPRGLRWLSKMKLTVARIHRSREFSTQDEGHDYHSVSFFWLPTG